MQITLRRPDLERFVAEKVESGEYATPEAVVETALEALRIHDAAIPGGKDLERLIAEGQAAADRGECIPGEQVFREIRQHSARYRAGSA
ncbi:MAG: hypothetical protein AMXMBFR83_19310 [Phycisphaerae bacterium]